MFVCASCSLCVPVFLTIFIFYIVTYTNEKPRCRIRVKIYVYVYVYVPVEREGRVRPWSLSGMARSSRCEGHHRPVPGTAI